MSHSLLSRHWRAYEVSPALWMLLELGVVHLFQSVHQLLHLILGQLMLHLQHWQSFAVDDSSANLTSINKQIDHEQLLQHGLMERGSSAHLSALSTLRWTGRPNNHIAPDTALAWWQKRADVHRHLRHFQHGARSLCLSQKLVTHLAVMLLQPLFIFLIKIILHGGFFIVWCGDHIPYICRLATCCYVCNITHSLLQSFIHACIQ